MKEKKKNMAEARKQLKLGNEEGARLYTQNAQNNIYDHMKFLKMSARLNAISGKIKSNYNSAEIMQNLT